MDYSRLSEQDGAVILQSLRAHLWSHGDLPRSADLVAAFFGRLSRTDYNLGKVEAKIRALRRWFREADAALCDGTGCPAPGHGLRMYALSLEVWGATDAVVAPLRLPLLSRPQPPTSTATAHALDLAPLVDAPASSLACVLIVLGRPPVPPPLTGLQHLCSSPASSTPSFSLTAPCEHGGWARRHELGAPGRRT